MYEDTINGFDWTNDSVTVIILEAEETLPEAPRSREGPPAHMKSNFA